VENSRKRKSLSSNCILHVRIDDELRLLLVEKKEGVEEKRKR
jgi:hypothetical protein